MPLSVFKLHRIVTHQNNDSLKGQTNKKRIETLYPNKDVFEGHGCIRAPRHIEVDSSFTSVVHPPIKIPLALQENVKQ